MTIFSRTICGLLLLLTTAAYAQDHGITLPVKVYRYSFDGVPEMSSEVTDADIAELFAQANNTWARAGIKWVPILVDDRFVATCQIPEISTDPEQFKEQLRSVTPPVPDGTWQIILVGEFPVPAAGLYLPDTHTAYVSGRAKGGPTSPLIMAHELGHSLALKHTKSPSNLMYPRAGCLDCQSKYASALTREQVRTARSQAVRGPQ